MQQRTGHISVHTKGRKLYDITPQVIDWVESSGLRTGMVTLYIQHTSASLLINENYDHDVLVDMECRSLIDWYLMETHYLFTQLKGQMICLHMCGPRLRKLIYPFHY